MILFLIFGDDQKVHKYKQIPWFFHVINYNAIIFLPKMDEN